MTLLPPVYAVFALHAAMPAHEPVPGVGVGVTPGVGVVPGVGVGDDDVPEANWTIIFVKSQSLCGTLLHVPESDPLLSGGLHWRSRLSDQKV